MDRILSVGQVATFLFALVCASSFRDNLGVRLPASRRPIVGQAKVCDYLPSNSHPIGRFKAAFFRALGYSDDNWEAFATELRRHALENDVSRSQETPYGLKHEIHGTLTGPSGRTVQVVSVWIARHGEDAPRLITAYPGKDS